MFSWIVSQVSYLVYSSGFWIVRFFIIAALFASEWINNPDLPSQYTYDYIIGNLFNLYAPSGKPNINITVGAGTAGNTILSEMPSNVNVLLVEAGAKTSLRFLEIPIITPALQRSSLDWSYTTEPQKHACGAMKGNRCRLAAGRGFGGSNILNNMIYHRGDKNDYRGWFKDPQEYNYEQDIRPLFNEIEDQLLPVELQHLTELGQIFSRFDASAKHAENLSFKTPRVLQRDGHRIKPDNYDHFDRKSARHDLLFGAQATKLLFNDHINHISGLELKKNNQIIKVYAKKGYIITSGAIGTPKLLLHSGIGNCEDLENEFVACHLNLPNVGRNLQDHMATGLDLITLNTTLNIGLRDILHPLNIFNFFFNEGKSQWSMVGCEAIGFHKSVQNHKDKPLLGFMVLPMGISTDAGACIRENLNIDDATWKDYFHHLQKDQIISILPIVLQPKSRGYVMISSSDVDKPPIVHPQYLSHPDDLQTLVDGIKIIQDELLKRPELKRLNAHLTQRPLSGCERFQLFSSKYWECYVKRMSFSIYHLGGTCRMGDPNDLDTVVDRKNFLVKGINNLYIADASIMPTLPSGNMNAAVVVIAKQFMRTLFRHEINQKIVDIADEGEENTEELPVNQRKSILREDL